MTALFQTTPQRQILGHYQSPQTYKRSLTPPIPSQIQMSQQRWQFFSTRVWMGPWLFCRESLTGARHMCALTAPRLRTLYIQVIFATLVGSTTVLPCRKSVIFSEIRLSVNMVLPSRVASLHKVLILVYYSSMPWGKAKQLLQLTTYYKLHLTHP